MRKKVKVYKFDVKTKKHKIVEEEIDFPDVEIKIYNPIEDINKKIEKIENEYVKIKTTSHSWGNKNFPTLTIDSVQKKIFPSSIISTVKTPIPAGLVRVSIDSRVYGGNDGTSIYQPKLIVYYNKQKIAEVWKDSIEARVSLNKVIVSSGGLLQITASNTGDTIFREGIGPVPCGYAPKSPWLIYVNVLIKSITI